MDTITHLVSGGLLGKAYFSNDRDNFQGRVSILAVTFGSVFPDSDILIEAFSRDPLAIAKIHRGFTHSFIGLPIFAALFAWLTRWGLRKWGRDCPSTGLLFLAYAVGIASHIVLDGMTSFGTRMWMPISNARVAWDLLFIVDFGFSAILLVPQIAAWVYSGREKAVSKAIGMWALCSAGTIGVWEIARAIEFPFSLWWALLIVIVLAGLFFFPGGTRADSRSGGRRGAAAGCTQPRFTWLPAVSRTMRR
ncbi:MAG: metal-dependent hydrolase [Candidatus Acidiferrales bacterium]